MNRLSLDKRTGAFSLPELMIALVIGGMILGAMVVGFGAFQQVFAATDDYYRATSDQMRVLDFIAQDMRRATSGSVSNNGQTLTLVVPDYLDESQNPPVPRTPAISAKGTVTYGSVASQPTAVYTLSGNSPNQIITRTYTPTAGVPVVMSLTMGSADYQFLCFDPASPGTLSFTFGGSGEPPSVTAQITFMPKFNRFRRANSRAGTTASLTVVVRNHS